MIRILMIDDDKDMCDEMVDILETDGFAATAVCDPAQGLQFALDNKYDLLLLDLKMPGITGYDILHTIKQRDTKIKIMVITGSPLKKVAGSELDSEEITQNDILGLADSVINKSADIGTILDKIKELMQQG